MLLFRKKKKEYTNSFIWIHDWERLKIEYPVGHKFGYLNRGMIVIRHKSYIPGIHSVTTWIPERYPELVCEYVDNNGIIQNKTFDTVQWLNLLKKAS